MVSVQDFYFPQPILDFLNKSLFGFGVIDFWLLVHAISAIVLFILFFKLLKSKKVAFILVIVFLIVFELFEIFLFNQNLAIREPILNSILDVIVGILSIKIYKNENTKR